MIRVEKCGITFRLYNTNTDAQYAAALFCGDWEPVYVEGGWVIRNSAGVVRDNGGELNSKFIEILFGTELNMSDK